MIGGDWQGKNPNIKNATNTTVEQGAKIKADAIDQGNGGKVVIWSNDKTFFDGFISARGGANGGDGGKVETSGHTLVATGKVDTTAPYGKTGMWLLDPALGCISDGASCTVPGLSNPIPVTQSTANLDAALALADVYMQVTDVAAFQTSKTFVVSAISGLPSYGRNLSLNAPYIYLAGSIDALTNSVPLRFDAFASGTSASLPAKSGVVEIASGGNTYRSLEALSLHATKTVSLPNDVDFRVKYFNIYADDYLSYQPSGTVTWWQNNTNSSGYSSSFTAPYISLGGTATFKSNGTQAWNYIHFNTNLNATSATYPSKSGMIELQPGTNWTFSLLGISTTTYYQSSISLQASNRLVLGANSKIAALRDSTSAANANTDFSVDFNAPIVENNGLTLIGDWTATSYYNHRNMSIRANSLVGAPLTTQGFDSVDLGPWYDYYNGGTAAPLGDVLLGVSSCTAPDWCITDPRTWAIGDYSHVGFNSNYYGNTTSTTGGNLRWLGPLTLPGTITFVSAHAQRSLTLDTPIDFGATRGVSLGAGWGGDNVNVPHDLVINQPITAREVNLQLENNNNSTTVSALKLNKPLTASYLYLYGYSYNSTANGIGWAFDINQPVIASESFQVNLNGKGTFVLNTPIETKNLYINQRSSASSAGYFGNTAVINQPITVNSPITSTFENSRIYNYGSSLTLNAPIKSSTSIGTWLYPVCADGSYTCANPTLATFINKAGAKGLSAGVGWFIGQPYGSQTIDFGGMTASGPLSLADAQVQTTLLSSYKTTPYTTGTYYVGNGTGVPPTSPIISLTNDTGASLTDKVTNNPALTLSTPTAGATRTISVDSGTASSSYVAPTTDGQHTVVVTDTNTNGQSASSTFIFTLDKTAAAPTIVLTADTGTNTTDKLTSNASLTVSTLPVGSIRTYSIDGAVATSNYSAPTGAGQHTVIVTDTDVAGNVAAASFGFTLYVSINSPTLTLATDTGSSNLDKVTNNAALNVSTLPSGVTRTYAVDGAAPASVYTPPTVDGNHTVVVTDTNAVGDVANASLTFTLDKIGPAKPTIGLAATTGNTQLVVDANTFPNLPEVTKALSSIGIQSGQTIEIITATSGALSAESLTVPGGITRTYFR